MLGNCDLIAIVLTKQPDKARTFYENILGLRFVSDDPSAVIYNANGTMLRMVKVNSFTPVSYTVVGWQVEDINSVIDSLHAKGVAFERFSGMIQDDRGVCIFASGAKVAWFKDPDGNLLSLTQF